MSKNIFNSPPKQTSYLLQSLPSLYSPQAKTYSNIFFSPKQHIENSSQSPKVFISPKKLEHINCIIPKEFNTGGLYIGNSIATLKQSILIDNNIEAIICCNAQASNNLRLFNDSDRRLQFKFMDIQDHQFYPINNHFEQAYQYIEKHRGANKNVLIQCHGGVSRSGTILIAYLMKKNSWDFQTTFQFVTKKRPRIKPNIGFCKILQQYQQNILQSTSKQLGLPNQQKYVINNVDTFTKQLQQSHNNDYLLQRQVSPFSLIQNIQNVKTKKINQYNLITKSFNEYEKQEYNTNKMKQNKNLVQNQNPELQKKKCFSSFSKGQSNYFSPIKINTMSQIQKNIRLEIASDKKNVQNNQENSQYLRKPTFVKTEIKPMIQRNLQVSTKQNVEYPIGRIDYSSHPQLNQFNILSPRNNIKVSPFFSPTVSVKFNYSNY